MASQDAPGSSQLDVANLYGESDVSLIKQVFILLAAPSVFFWNFMLGHDCERAQALISEQVCPEILQYQEDLVKRLESQIANQVQNVLHAPFRRHYFPNSKHRGQTLICMTQEATIEELNKDPEQDLLKMIYTVEVQRVKYSLRGYLRARLKKLEQHVMHCLDNPEMKERLSEKEVKYAEEYFLLLGEQHFE